MLRRITLAAAAAALFVGSAAAQLVPGGEGAPPPPGPGNTQRDLDKQYSDLLAGRWVINYNVMGMQYTNDIVYRPDGSLVGTQIVRQYGEMRYTIKGTWKVSGIDDKSFNLTVMLVGSGTSTDTLQVVDRNTLFSQNTQENAYRTE